MKYAKFGVFLAASKQDSLPLSFAEIERILGAKLPASAHKHRPWWSNNPSNNAFTKVWLDAGYRTEAVDMKARRLVFRRAGRNATVASRAAQFTEFYGSMKDLIWIEPGYDLTQPPDPDLTDYLDAKYGPERRKA